MLEVIGEKIRRSKFGLDMKEESRSLRWKRREELGLWEKVKESELRASRVGGN